MLQVLLDLQDCQVSRAHQVSQVVWGILGHQELQLLMVGMAKLVHQDLSVRLDLQAREVHQGLRAFQGWMVL